MMPEIAQMKKAYRASCFLEVHGSRFLASAMLTSGDQNSAVLVLGFSFGSIASQLVNGIGKLGSLLGLVFIHHFFPLVFLYLLYNISSIFA